MVTVYTIGLTVALCAAVALTIAIENRAGTAPGAGTAPSRLSILAASFATLSTLTYLMAGPDHVNLFSFAISNTAAPLSAAFLAAALRALAGRRTYLVPSIVLCVGAGVVTATVSPDAGFTTKLIVSTLLAAFAAISCATSDVPRTGRALVSASMSVYAAYTGAQAFVPLIWGPDAPGVQATLSIGPSLLVAGVCVAGVTAGTVMIIKPPAAVDSVRVVNGRALTDWVAALLTQGSSVTAVTVSTPDLPLHRVAFGRRWTAAISRAVDDAVLSAMPVGSIVGRVAPGALVALQFGTAVAFDELRSRIEASYGERMPRAAPAEAPEPVIEPLIITAEADLQRYARRARATARRAMSAQGV